MLKVNITTKNELRSTPDWIVLTPCSKWSTQTRRFYISRHKKLVPQFPLSYICCLAFNKKFIDVQKSKENLLSGDKPVKITILIYNPDVGAIRKNLKQL